MSSSLAHAIQENCETVGAILKSLSHPVRLKILSQIMDKERSVNELTEFCEISQSAMSRFLGRMKNEGVVLSRRDQQFIYYRVADPRLIKLLRALKDIYC